MKKTAETLAEGNSVQMKSRNPAPPLVSVVINCFNGDAYLAGAIDSVYSQTLEDWEIVLWDNASTDSTPDIVRRYDSRLRYFRGEKTVPLGEARNLALEKTSGRYIAFLDCDDLWLPEKLEKQAALFSANPNLGLVCTDTIYFSGDRTIKRLYKSFTPPSGMVFKELMLSYWIVMSSAMVSREALEALDHWFDPRLRVAEEADLFYRIARFKELNCVLEPLTRLRIHGESDTFRKFGLFAEDNQMILDKYISQINGFEHETDIVRHLRSKISFQKSVDLWSRGHSVKCREMLRSDSLSLKRLLLFIISFFPASFFRFFYFSYIKLSSIIHF